MNRILILSSKESDLSDLILSSCPSSILRSPEEPFDPYEFDALCLLGGNSPSPAVYPAPVRAAIEQMRKLNKPVFSEYASAIGGALENGIVRTSHHRLVYSPDDFPINDLPRGAVLDDHKNDCINYCFRDHDFCPILTCHDYICAHDQINMTKEEAEKGIWALWWQGKSTLMCSFRISNFRRARLSPRDYWEPLIASIVSFLAGEKIAPHFKAPICSYKASEVSCASDTTESVSRAINWFYNAKMLKNGGCDGAYEGFSHHISAMDGSQKRANAIRTDCTSETAGAFLFDAIIRGNAESRKIADRLFKFVFDWMQIKDGEHKGMIRWSEVAWETCYQDDVARSVLPLLLSQYVDGKVPYFDQIKEGLTYLMDTTGEDGLRVSRTDISRLSGKDRETLKKSGVGIPCAHHNAYYLATLLLAYRAGADKRFLEVGEKGLCSIMATYPNTLRETSETEENCRLVLPLSILYEVTKNEKYIDWINLVVDNLQLRLHSFGGYAEWDTDYKANCSRNHTGECALLANNGDPVADLLYSNNWLPLGFAHAYLSTGDELFHNLWCGIASFFLSCQIHSEDKNLDGAWTRAFDMKHKEAHGVPHDVGWAPCCIETGWTMGEILMGLQFMHIAEKYNQKYH